MQKFNEWLTKTHGDELDAVKNNNMELVTDEDDALVANQLEQYADRINGILHNVAEDKRAAFLEKLINLLRNRV